MAKERQTHAVLRLLGVFYVRPAVLRLLGVFHDVLYGAMTDPPRVPLFKPPVSWP